MVGQMGDLPNVQLGLKFWWNDWQALGPDKKYAVVLPKLSDCKVVYRRLNANDTIADLAETTAPSKGGNLTEMVQAMKPEPDDAAATTTTNDNA